jgi:hypothetical protein
LKRTCTIHCLVAILLCVCFQSYAQKIQYSKQNIVQPYYDAIQTAANISGHHHIITFIKNERPVIHVFDELLQVQGKKEIDYKFRPGQHIQILAFKKLYFLYLHEPGSSQHELWKIDAEGNATQESKSFKKLIDTAFNRNMTVLQLVNKNNQLFIIGNVLYKDIEKVASTVVQADENLNTISTRKAVFPFSAGDGLRQVSLINENLFVLKTTSDSSGFLLELIKAELNTGKLFMNYFGSGRHYYMNPSFRYNIYDSSLLVYSLIRNTVFLSKVDTSLNYRTPVSLIKNGYKQSVGGDFLFVNGEPQPWINMNSGRSSADRIYSGQRTDRASVQNITNYERFGETAEEYSQRINGQGRYANSMSSRYGYYPGTTGRSAYQEEPPEPPFRFSIVNNRFELVRDSVLANNDKYNTVKVRSAANVVMNNKGYLIFNQTFRSKKQGLFLVGVNDNEELETSDIRVYDKFEYILSQLQNINREYCIIPFKRKSEIGLVKISMK